MRIVTAMMKHETNTFSPVPSDLRRFAQRGLRRGAEALDAYTGTNTPLGAYIDALREAGAEIVLPLAAEAPPSGLVHRDAYETMAGAIVDAVAAGCDAVMLDLHGAMVAEHLDDGEGTLLERIRAAAPGIPLCVALDMHCNLTARMVAHCDVMVGYKTYPHVDMRAAGAQAARILLGKLAGRCDPVMAWGAVPLLAQTLRMGTADAPMKELQEAARAAERGPILAATLFGGFPLADIHDAGVSAVVVADRALAAAEELRDRLLAAAWANRAEFVYAHRDLAATVAAAARLQNSIPSGRPAILLDHADNVASGGTSDVMTVIAEVLRQWPPNSRARQMAHDRYRRLWKEAGWPWPDAMAAMRGNGKAAASPEGVRAFTDEEIEELRARLQRSRKLMPADLVAWDCLAVFGLRPAELQGLELSSEDGLLLARVTRQKRSSKRSSGARTVPAVPPQGWPADCNGLLDRWQRHGFPVGMVSAPSPGQVLTQQLRRLRDQLLPRQLGIA